MTGSIDMEELKSAMREIAGTVNFSKTQEMISDAIARHDEEKSAKWTLDKHIPVALIFALVIQFAGAVWWSARTDTRIDALEQATMKSSSVEGRLAAIEEGQDWIKGLIIRIEQKIEKVVR